MTLLARLLPVLFAGLVLATPPVATPGWAQAPEPAPAVQHATGVAPHTGLDTIYRTFARGYDELDAAAVAALYTADALYLSGGSPAQRGREAIEANFAGFFDSVRADGARLEIGFEILDRQTADDLASDVGIYTLRRIGPDGSASRASRGRFTVIALREGDGVWRFHVDSFSSLDEPRPSAAPPPSAEDAPASDEEVEIRELRPGVWLHRSWHTFPSGDRFPSNGLAIVEGDGLLLVDTAWGELATVELLARLEEATGLPVRGAVATHHHYDRIAGSTVLAERGVAVAAHPRTLELAAAQGLPAPRVALAELASPGGHVRLGPVELLYPGAGHAEDNLVVWVPHAKVLFGGCAVRAGDSRSLGNTADADLASWSEALRRIRDRYPDAEVMVPGHGEPGGAELLEHTIAVIEAEPPRSR